MTDPKCFVSKKFTYTKVLWKKGFHFKKNEGRKGRRRRGRGGEELFKKHWPK